MIHPNDNTRRAALIPHPGDSEKAQALPLASLPLSDRCSEVRLNHSPFTRLSSPFRLRYTDASDSSVAPLPVAPWFQRPSIIPCARKHPQSSSTPNTRPRPRPRPRTMLAISGRRRESEQEAVYSGRLGTLSRAYMPAGVYVQVSDQPIDSIVQQKANTTHAQNAFWRSW